MTDAAGVEEIRARPRRHGGSKTLRVVAAAMVVIGGTAVAAALIDQDADPVSAPYATSEATSGAADVGGSEAPPSAPPPASATPSSPSTTVPPPPAVAQPLEVRIPAIGVQSELITVGLNPDGTLGVPQPGPTYDNAAWYGGSPKPGEVGAAVILGHVDSAANGPSIFYRLGALTAGAQVEVLRSDGTTATFLVDEVRAVPKNDFPTVEVYARTDRPELRLITCGGDIGADGHYVDNTVVFAHQI